MAGTQEPTAAGESTGEPTGHDAEGADALHQQAEEDDISVADAARRALREGLQAY